MSSCCFVYNLVLASSILKISLKQSGPRDFIGSFSEGLSIENSKIGPLNSINTVSLVIIVNLTRESSLTSLTFFSNNGFLFHLALLGGIANPLSYLCLS